MNSIWASIVRLPNLTKFSNKKFKQIAKKAEEYKIGLNQELKEKLYKWND